MLHALGEAGIDARMAAWRDPRENWDAPIPTLVRSTWDYMHMVGAFHGWTERVERAAPLFNPGPILRDNMHKRYLLGLAARGVPAVPTSLLPQGAGARADAWIADSGFDDIVLKPAIGAASFGTLRFTRSEHGVAALHAARLCANCDVILQPYLASVEGHGERSLVWIDGEFTHAVRKAPRFDGGAESVGAAIPVAPEERAVASRALKGLGGLLYARVDLVRDADGTPCVMELELIEPSLFLAQHPPALARLVAGLGRRIAGPA